MVDSESPYSCGHFDTKIEVVTIKNNRAVIPKCAPVGGEPPIHCCLMTRKQLSLSHLLPTEPPRSGPGDEYKKQESSHHDPVPALGDALYRQSVIVRSLKAGRPSSQELAQKLSNQVLGGLGGHTRRLGRREISS